MHRSRVPVISCGEDWGRMTGDSRRRFCAACQLHVENLSMRTEAEAIELLERAAEGRLCVRYEFDKKGEIVFRPEAKDPLPTRRGALAAGAMAAMLQGCASTPASTPRAAPSAPLHAADASAQSGGHQLPNVEPPVDTQTSVDPSKALLHGMVWNHCHQPVADAVITLTGPLLQGEGIVVTDSEGAFRIPNLPPGDGYVLIFEKEGYRPLKRWDLRLEAGRSTFVKVVIVPDAIWLNEDVNTLVGVVAIPPAVDSSSSPPKQTLDQDFWRRVPILR